MKFYTRPRLIDAADVRVGDEIAQWHHEGRHLVGEMLPDNMTGYGWLKVLDVQQRGGPIEIVIGWEVGKVDGTHYQERGHKVVIREVIEVDPWNLDEMLLQQSRDRHPSTAPTYAGAIARALQVSEETVRAGLALCDPDDTLRRDDPPPRDDVGEYYHVFPAGY